jgi:hypothetical protein
MHAGAGHIENLAETDGQRALIRFSFFMFDRNLQMLSWMEEIQAGQHPMAFGGF